MDQDNELRLSHYAERLDKQERSHDALRSEVISLAESVKSVSEDVRNIAKVSSENFTNVNSHITDSVNRLHEKLDINTNNNKPDVKGIFGVLGGTVGLLMTAFTIILALTVYPLTDSDKEIREINKNQSTLILEHVKTLSTISGRDEIKEKALNQRFLERDKIFGEMETDQTNLHMDFRKHIEHVHEIDVKYAFMMGELKSSQSATQRQLDAVDANKSRGWTNNSKKNK